MAGKKMTITIPLLPPSLNAIMRKGYYRIHAKKIKEWRDFVWLVAHKKPRDLTGFTFPAAYPLTVTSQIHYKLDRRRDTDNTISAVKIVLDCLVLCRFIPGDDTRYIGRVTLLPPKSKCERNETIIEIVGAE